MPGSISARTSDANDGPFEDRIVSAPTASAAKRQRRALRAGVLLLGLAPFVALAVRAAAGGLGANPVEEVTHETGEWALRFLVLCLCVTPARRLTGWRPLQLERRTLGLFAFGYAALHLATYLTFELELDPGLIVEGVLERPYITVGFGAFAILSALAMTSTRAAARRLGKRWKQLHRLVYLAAIGAVVHFLWLVKSDLREPLVYGAIVAGLLGLRLWWRVVSPRLRGEPAVPAG
jgi:sulfoxide reductase heme-binding subunit YedZ